MRRSSAQQALPLGPEPGEIRRAAVLSECGRYRYTLSRDWGEERHRDDWHRILWVGLNPSTADALKDDATVIRWIGYSKAWGYDGFDVVNLFAYRSRSPILLRTVDDPVGPGNDEAIKAALGDAAMVVVCWGAVHAALHWRAEEVRRIVAAESEPLALGLTKDGAPLHPLRLRKDLVPVSLAELERLHRERRRG